MKITNISIHLYQIPLKSQQIRSGALIQVTDQDANHGWGEIAPLPQFSQESLNEALHQLVQKKEDILKIDWNLQTYSSTIHQIKLYPSVEFGLESAILSILENNITGRASISALLMGSQEEILELAEKRLCEGYRSAKLKVSQLTFSDAFEIIHALKDKFHLRIDVNRAWETEESLRFFSEFPKDAFEYVEEPFKNPNDLIHFSHPLAIDESFPHHFTLEQLAKLPQLRALIYKPSIQGGEYQCSLLKKWTDSKDVSLIFSSSFESDIGLAQIALMAQRLSIVSPIGIGTYHYLASHLSAQPLQIQEAQLNVTGKIFPKAEYLNYNVTIQVPTFATQTRRPE